MKHTKQSTEEAIANLRETLKPGDTVYTVMRHVSRSGMSRSIDAYVMVDNQPRWISRFVSNATGLPFDERREAIKMGGCGMDMGFALVYQLSQTLFGGGFECIGEGCPSNDHTNGDRDYTPHKHSSGGYALNHTWM